MTVPEWIVLGTVFVLVFVPLCIRWWQFHHMDADERDHYR